MTRSDLDSSPNRGLANGTASGSVHRVRNCRHRCRRVVDSPITGGVPDFVNPTRTQTGTSTVPGDFRLDAGLTFDSRGQILVSGDTSSNNELLTAIGGSRALG